MKEVLIEKKRYEGLDIVRVLANILVLTVHFFLRTKYYSSEMIGLSMNTQSIIRNLCMSCVPLFLILTGYLNKKSHYDKKFFKGLLEILVIWLFYSTIEFLCINIFTSNSISLFTYIGDVFNFRMAYSWYIKMYIGLYFLSPIINNAYERFNNRDKIVVIIGIILLTVLPCFTRAFFNDLLILPDYWVCIYTVCYYLLGKCIYDYKPKLSKKTNIILLMFNMVLIYLYQFIAPVDYQDFLIFTQSLLLFLLFYNVSIKNNKIRKIVAYASSITLDIYMASSLIDRIVYKFYFKIFKLDELGQNKIIIYAPIFLITSYVICFIYGSIRKKIINVR